MQQGCWEDCQAFVVPASEMVRVLRTDVTPVQFALNLLHLLNQMSVITIHITRPMRHMVFTLWACGSRRDCRQCSRPLLAWCRRHRSVYRWHNGGAGKIARHLWFWPVRGSGFPDDVMPAQSALNLLHLLNRVSVITIHSTGPIRHMMFMLWICGSRRDCRQCSGPLLA